MARHGRLVLTIALALVHLHGKLDPRPGRKMGHLTALGESPAEAIRKVLAARDVLV